MPKSKGRKKRPRTPKRVVKEDGLHLRSLSFGDRSEEIKAAMLQGAKEKVDQFPGLIDKLFNLLRDRSPEGILSTVAFYGSQASLSDRGEIKSLSSDVLQHHIELLQGLILTLPTEEWGVAPVTGQYTYEAFELLPDLAETFFCSRLVARSLEKNPSKQAIIDLQEKIRMHTQAVRNWGYYSDVLRISRAIVTTLDQKFVARLGYSPTDLIDIGEHLVTELERRNGKHYDYIGAALAAKTPAEMVRLYYANMPGIQGEPEDFLDSLPANISREQMASLILSHADLRHIDYMSFAVADVATATGKSEQITLNVLNRLSIKPNELVGTKVDHLFLGNPVWTRPGINFIEKYVFPIPQAIFSHVNEIVRAMARDAKLENELSDRRSIFLEEHVSDLFRAALPSATIKTGVKWRVGEQQFESDVLAIVDRTAVIVEAKSHRVTPEGLRGAPDRLRRHLTDLVIEPSIQSERLATLIARENRNDPDAVSVAQQLGIDAEEIDQVIRLSVTLDDLSILSSSEEDLRSVDWIPKDHALAPSMHVADLGCIIEILADEAHILHYLLERFFVQKQFDLMGDELDFLGLYLSTGFNMGLGDQEMRRLIISGMSGPIDRYFEARQAGLPASRPTVNLGGFYKNVLERLRSRKSNGWLTAAFHLLNSAGREQQQKIYPALQKLRKNVKRNGDIEGHKCLMLIKPALDRKARVGFFLHDGLPSAEKRRRMEHLGVSALNEEDARVCVLFGKNINDWGEPYDSVLTLHEDEAEKVANNRSE